MTQTAAEVLASLAWMRTLTGPATTESLCVNKEKKMSFEFTQDGRTYRVRSVTGDGLTKFEWQELNPPAPEALEPSEDA